MQQAALCIKMEGRRCMNWNLKVKIVETFRSQADFAMAVKERESIVSKVIRGRRRLSREKQEKWAKILKCQPEEIFKEE